MCQRQRIGIAEKRNIFPLLDNKHRGIGVDPITHKAICVKVIKQRVGVKYHNEIHEDSTGAITMIKYMMSSNRFDGIAFDTSFLTKTPVRVLLCESALDSDCGWWSIEHLELDASEKYAILKPITFSHLENHNVKNRGIIKNTRSNLESQWAKFFEALCLPYEYESSNFTLLPGKTYTPDFFLLDSYFEIKPMPPSIETMHKCAVLSSQNKRVVILGGYPIEPFVLSNGWNEQTHRYNEETSERYSGIIFENGKILHSKAVFMEIDGKIDICGITEQNTIYSQCWISPELKKAYEVARKKE